MAASTQGSTARAILYAFLANLGIALAKSWAAWLTGSGSMLAEAIHSYADSGNQVLLYLGIRQSARKANTEHPLGYGKLSYFWSFIVAMMLFSAGGLFSVFEGVDKLKHPEPLEMAWLALLVLGIAIVLETLSLLGCLREIRHIRGDRAFGEWLKHTRSSELVVVFGEDVAALIGLALAFVFVSLASLTGNTVFDAVGSICIGVVLLIISVFLVVRMQSLLVGRSADPLVRQTIDDMIRVQPDIVEVYNTITMQFGADTMLAAKIRLKPGIDIEHAVDIINALERELKTHIPELRWCFVEPDTSD
jgi:cation diffusion facilitator family transporter